MPDSIRLDELELALIKGQQNVNTMNSFYLPPRLSPVSYILAFKIVRCSKYYKS